MCHSDGGEEANKYERSLPLQTTLLRAVDQSVAASKEPVQLAGAKGSNSAKTLLEKHTNLRTTTTATTSTKPPTKSTAVAPPSSPSPAPAFVSPSAKTMKAELPQPAKPNKSHRTEGQEPGPTDYEDATQNPMVTDPDMEIDSYSYDQDLQNGPGKGGLDEDEFMDGKGEVQFMEEMDKDLAALSQAENVDKIAVMKATTIYKTQDEDTHFFFHLVIVAFLVVIVYITYHNKRKIFLLAQSRRWRDSLCSHSVEYRRLDQNVNEAMPSLKMTNDYIF
ncbi:keratinocyte-associated transmembrane protein 2-like [Arapaima gigas]